ncbi:MULTISPECIES: ATP-binding cassette domain-containing protein [unclassified Ruegeria]|uniref:ATP-binding cassette domain-containing protein n=1 Tax=unclassified Ruegeria TaxID=2625375 RepID=UPI0014897B6E|nr:MULTISPECIES: ATP-binding cassette domain-containing protein [unclassified Ruegeria]NOD77900.1 ATP-binding cassette domain-containing protein [Ruegeria sp. HKCCD4332]NOD88131.1 ATP-binding cassette domain-containing protein [Ruegeria sp. HKCCD4318]NOD93817.1 ATP-binding cassette domain-containing protein [Ruegeria sp. HKCCD4884]NOE14979.1 ATP-binding cassette domain-containing protein [Ruegeria sp. HKCCD4318-2]NOG11418.1 ATP-binding cassette domain-containing protein [Ruegeria sp. HKCCD4315
MSSNDPDTVLSIRNLGIERAPGFFVVIEELDLKAGETIVLDAVSGAGKSTALGLIAGALPLVDLPDMRHEIAGVQVAPDTPRAAFAGPDRLGFVLQTNTLVPYLNLLENIELPVRVAGQAPDAEWQDHLIRALGLGDYKARKPGQLSVGQRQRVSVARALLGRPALLLLDEPVSALDPANVAEVEGLIVHLAAEAGSAVVLASHQAQTGDFANAPRADHRLIDHQGQSYSIFSTAGRVAARVA